MRRWEEGVKCGEVGGGRKVLSVGRWEEGVRCGEVGGMCGEEGGEIEEQDFTVH